MDDICREIQPLVKQPDAVESDQYNTAFLSIDGMNCGNCANRVRNALLSTYGVISVTIDLTQGLSEVQFNPMLTDLSQLVERVAASGNDGHHHYIARVISQL